MGDVKHDAAMTVPKKEQNAGVALLLERMKTNPEEFTVGDKWSKILHDYKDFLEVEDRQALAEKINELMQQKFTEKVLEELVDPTQNTLTKILREKARLGAIPDGMFGSATIKAEGGTVSYG